MRRYSFTLLDGSPTTIHLEHDFLDGLREAAVELNMLIRRLIHSIDEKRTGSRASAIRLFVYRYSKQRTGTRPEAAGTTPEG